MSNGGITVLGAPQETETTTIEQQNTENTTTETVEQTKETETTETVETKKPEEEKTETTQGKETEKPEDTKETEKRKPEAEQKPKTLNFDVSTPGQETETTKSNDKPETPALTEDLVVNYLKSEKNLDIKNLSDLSKKEELPDVVAEFKKFHEKTGRGHTAYFNSKRNWDNENKGEGFRNICI